MCSDKVRPQYRNLGLGHIITDVLIHAGHDAHCQEFLCTCVCRIESLDAACRQIPRSCTLFCSPGKGVYRYIYGHKIQLPSENRCAAPAHRQQACPCTSAGTMLTAELEPCSHLCRQDSAGGPHPVAASWEAPCSPKQPPHEPRACSPGAQPWCCCSAHIAACLAHPESRQGSAQLPHHESFHI